MNAEDSSMNSQLNDTVVSLKKKIKLLVSELDSSNQSCKVLEEALQASQEALKLMSEAQKNKAVPTKESQKAPNQGYFKVIDELNLENRLLLVAVKDLIREKSIAQCKGLVLEQIADMTEVEYTTLINAFNKTLTERKTERGSSEKQMQSSRFSKDQNLINQNGSLLNTPSEEKALLKVRPADLQLESANLAAEHSRRSSKVAYPPSRELMEIYKEVDQYKKVVDRASQQIMHLQSEKQEILKINFVGRV